MNMQVGTMVKVRDTIGDKFIQEDPIYMVEDAKVMWNKYLVGLITKIDARCKRSVTHDLGVTEKGFRMKVTEDHIHLPEFSKVGKIVFIPDEIRDETSRYVQYPRLTVL